MAVFLLDTTVIIDTINGKRGRGQLLDHLLAERNLLACCPINVTEVYAGMRPHEGRSTQEFLRSLKFYETTWEIARFAGELKSIWAAKGQTLSVPDVTIDAVALTNDLTLVTDNRKHFPMAELRLLELPVPRGARHRPKN
jgi:tRNA(fMet)-specific endonuclease VapC